MSLIEKLKNIFNKKEDPLLETKERPIVKIEPKYKNMTLLAPGKTIYDGDENYFHIEAYDENNEPIGNETIKAKISGDEYEFVTDETGLVKWLVDLPPKEHVLKIEFPNGEYSQIIESVLTIHKAARKPKNPKPKKIDERHCSLNAPNMKMYIHSEGQFYAKLRDYRYRSIANEKVKITLNDETHELITDRRGFARLDIKDLGPGKYDVISEFEGSEKYDSCKTESQLHMAIRDIDKEVIIDVKNLTMEFKVTKDKIDTIKEFIIRTIKRNKEEHEKIKVIDDISFKVYKGDKLGILGFNGAGKSTLLKIMSGIYEPTSGSITTYGKIAPLLELGAGFDKNYTGKNNIYLNGALLSISEDVLKEKYDEIVEFSELGEFINYPIKNYSSGMRTKLGFSIATQINPDILIIDEILSVGDIKFKKKSADKINSMMKDGVTVLLVSHSIPQIKKICDRCIWLENGKIKMYGEAEDVCEAYVKGARREYKKEKNKNK